MPGGWVTGPSYVLCPPGNGKVSGFFFFFFLLTLLFHNFLNFNISSVICFLLTGVTTSCVSQGVYGFILM